MQKTIIDTLGCCIYTERGGGSLFLRLIQKGSVLGGAHMYTDEHKRLLFHPPLSNKSGIKRRKWEGGMYLGYEQRGKKEKKKEKRFTV